MGDVVSLVEKAAETIEQDEAEALAKKIQKGQFDLEDMLKQLRQLKKMGGLDGLLGMLPGIGKMKKQLDQANIDPNILKRQEAIILSMTPKERRNPKIIHASRKKRIADGAGASVQDINKLLKQWMEMSKMMKRMGKMAKKGKMPGMPPGFPPGGGMPPGGLPPGFPPGGMQ
jgi:signal recognition particle subunit SRP54